MLEEKKKPKRINSKAKGNGFENKVSKLLAANLAPLCFKRSQMSGAILGGVNAKNVDDYSIEMRVLFVGDVSPSNEGNGNPKFNFVVECKAYKEAERTEALLGGHSLIYKWMNEASTDAAKVDKRGILICKWNNTSLYACVEPDIVLPEGVKFITLVNGVNVCFLEELLKHTAFWMT